MKKSILIVMIMFLISLAPWSQGTLGAQEAQSAKEIVDKSVAALGGEEAVKKQLDFSAEGQFKISMRMMELSGEAKWIFQAPKSWNKFKVVFAGNEVTQTQAFDGKSAWMERMGTLADQPTLNNESDLAHSIGLLLEKNASFSLAKETEIEGKKAVGVEVDFKGKKTTFFIDRENFLPLEIVFEDYYFGESSTRELLEKRIRCLEYKNIAGVLFPTKTAFYLKGKKLLELDFDKVMFNQKVSADIFARPDQEPDLRYMEEMVN
jgi:hypothetical protein